MPEKTKVYVSAPINGTEDGGEKLFAIGKKMMLAIGFDPVLPTELQPHQHEGDCPAGRRSIDREHNEACYLRSDLQALLQCDAILLMPGWTASWGCKLELEVAGSCGLEFWVAMLLKGPGGEPLGWELANLQ
jgi:hypothetical protein